MYYVFDKSTAGVTAGGHKRSKMSKPLSVLPESVIRGFEKAIMVKVRRDTVIMACYDIAVSDWTSPKLGS